MTSNGKDHDGGERHSQDIPMPDCEDEPESSDHNAEHPPDEGEHEAEETSYYHQHYRPKLGRTNTVRGRLSNSIHYGLTN
jgi:hypothetical protein